MMNRTSSCCFAAVLLGLVLQLGCAERGLSGQRLPVVGTLSLDGKPVPYAVVEFSQDVERGEVQAAVVREGRFSLDAAAGLPAGAYSVAVTPYVPEIEEAGSLTPAERTRIAAAQTAIPEVYQKRGVLKATVEGSGASALALSMESKSK